MQYDFSGWATRNDMKCADGRTIRRNAFVGNDGQTVPLVWQHKHDDPKYVLGHALLQNSDEGVYAYCTLNDGQMGRQAAELVKNGDVSHLSIYANQLKQSPSGDVLHGVIREVSLVLSGANPGAYIDHRSLTHSGDVDMNEADIYNDVGGLELYHSDEEDPDEYDEEDQEEYDEEEYDEEDPEDSDEEDYDEESDPEDDSEDEDYEEDSDSEDDEDDEEFEHSGLGGTTMDDNRTVGDIIATMNEDQQDVLAMIIGALGDEGDDSVKHNVFESEEDYNAAATDELMHSAMEAIIADAKNSGTMSESFLKHADEYGITNIDYLFPDYQTLQKTPEFIQRKMEWVAKVMSAVHHTPFSRIKSIFADITEDEARAKGYIKGNRKKEEVFSLLKRTTDPQTIYKKQKMDRDDVVDITDFDVVSWIKTEMRMMLDEELARAILIGDGRLASSDDKISESHVRPVWKDDDLYTIHVPIVPESGETVSDAIIRLSIKSRKDYRGTGNPTMYTTEDTLTDMLLLKDLNKRYIYDNQEKLATTLRVSSIVTVPVMEEITQYRTDSAGKKWKVVALIVNLTDYNVGADKGGAINMFDDFDIDYNQMKYLIETRISGALTKPYSAIALETEVEDEESAS